jgi:hypothetical protein
MSYSRAFNRLRNLITDRKLYECLMHYQSKNELDFNLGFQYAVCERVFVNTKPRYGYGLFLKFPFTFVKVRHRTFFRKIGTFYKRFRNDFPIFIMDKLKHLSSH